MSTVTKKYKVLYRIFSLISVLSLISPVIYGIISGYIAADLIHEKVTLTMTIFCSLILILINVILKWHIRSPLWILLLGVYYCLDNILPIIIAIAVFTVLDELLFSPIAKHFKTKYTINNEIDKRM